MQGLTLRLEIPAAESDEARGSRYETPLDLLLREDRQRLGIGFSEPEAGRASFVSTDLVVARASAGRRPHRGG